MQAIDPFFSLKHWNGAYRKFMLLTPVRDGKEIVVVRVQGEDNIVTSYIGFIKSNYPDHAEVEEIVEKDFDGPVEDIFKFAQILQFEQIAKAVPAIISIDKKQDIMIEKQDIMIEKQETTIHQKLR